MNGNGNYMTRETHMKLSAELERMKRRKQDLSRQIGVAAAHGDLRENGEYHAAKEEQQNLLRRIAELEGRLKTAQFTEDLNIPRDKVYIGATVTLERVGDGAPATYQLVGSSEADPGNGKLSVETPLARGLLGHGLLEEVVIQLPAGPARVKILSITR